MTDTRSFCSFMRAIRDGDQDAARELVRRFEGVIRREARLRMEDPRLHRVFDSMDISQSVLISFFRGPRRATSSWRRPSSSSTC